MARSRGVLALGLVTLIAVTPGVAASQDVAAARLDAVILSSRVAADCLRASQARSAADLDAIEAEYRSASLTMAQPRTGLVLEIALAGRRADGFRRTLEDLQHEIARLAPSRPHDETRVSIVRARLSVLREALGQREILTDLIDMLQRRWQANPEPVLLLRAQQAQTALNDIVRTDGHGRISDLLADIAAEELRLFAELSGGLPLADLERLRSTLSRLRIANDKLAGAQEEMARGAATLARLDASVQVIQALRRQIEQCANRRRSDLSRSAPGVTQPGVVPSAIVPPGRYRMSEYSELTAGWRGESAVIFQSAQGSPSVVGTEYASLELIGRPDARMFDLQGAIVGGVGQGNMVPVNPKLDGRAGKWRLTDRGAGGWSGVYCSWEKDSSSYNTGVIWPEGQAEPTGALPEAMKLCPSRRH